jgi:hypothetical protein
MEPDEHIPLSRGIGRLLQLVSDRAAGEVTSVQAAAGLTAGDSDKSCLATTSRFIFFSHPPANLPVGSLTFRAVIRQAVFNIRRGGRGVSPAPSSALLLQPVHVPAAILTGGFLFLFPNANWTRRTLRRRLVFHFFRSSFPIIPRPPNIREVVMTFVARPTGPAEFRRIRSHPSRRALLIRLEHFPGG